MPITTSYSWFYNYNILLMLLILELKICTNAKNKNMPITTLYSRRGSKMPPSCVF